MYLLKVNSANNFLKIYMQEILLDLYEKKNYKIL